MLHAFGWLKQHRHHIKANHLRRVLHSADVVGCAPGKPPPFLVVHSVFRGAMQFRRAGFHFDKHQQRPLYGNQVDF